MVEIEEDRVRDKIEEIEKFLDQLESVIPLEFESYKNDFKVKAVCERYFEKIIEAVVDLAFLFIKEKKLKIPEEDTQAFDILFDNNLISDSLRKNLKEAKGMRNVIAHEYGKIDDKKVFHAVSEELIDDVKEFIKCIKEIK